MIGNEYLMEGLITSEVEHCTVLCMAVQSVWGDDRLSDGLLCFDNLDIIVGFEVRHICVSCNGRGTACRLARWVYYECDGSECF